MAEACVQSEDVTRTFADIQVEAHEDEIARHA